MQTPQTLKERFLNLAAHVLNGDFNKPTGELDEQALRDQVFRWANYTDHAPRGLFAPVAGRAVVLAPTLTLIDQTTNVSLPVASPTDGAATPSPPAGEAPPATPRRGRQRKPAQE